jgi:hypothetical protein
MLATIIVGPERVSMVGRVVVVMIVDAEELLVIAHVRVQRRDWHTLGRSPYCFGGTSWWILTRWTGMMSRTCAYAKGD